MFYVYAWYEPNGTCFYVGKGCGDRYRRRDRRNQHWRAIAALHEGNVTVKLLCENLTEDEAFRLEVVTIRELQPRANKTIGGEGVTGYTHTQDALNRSGAAQKTLWADPVYKAKMREAHRGPLTAEHRAAIGNAHRGMIRPIETGQKIAASKLGKPRSEETKAKIRATLLARSASRGTTTGNY